MQYLRLIYEAESRLAQKTEADMQQTMMDYGAFTADIQAAGQFSLLRECTLSWPLRYLVISWRWNT